MAKAAPPPPPPPSAPIDVNLRDALEERYLAYALSTIMGRALPDARDGLKPVHRRILYGMHILRLDPGTAFKKCAKIVGDVMGSFHPHGDQAIYEALVRLAQDFSSRYPLIEGQGNFGNIDGDNAAAYRYTEARMTDVARLIMEGVDEDSVDWRDNYSGDAQEPIVMPSAVPNLLANGAQGIAVGMATSIPPHNIAELCDAALYLIAHPDAETEALTQFVQGPDFPTGGVVIDDRAAIVETYRTGPRRLSPARPLDEGGAGRGGWAAVVTEIPYGVQKSRLIEQIANLLNEKKLPLLADVRDELTEDVRIVLEPRSRAVEPATLMESLFRLSELETRISVNMNVLVDGVTPRVVSLREALQQWLDHRRVVLVRRSRHRLAAIDKRLELLAGMIVVFLNLDEVIRIIREEDDPKEALKSRFDLTELQVVYVLDTRLRSLRRLEEMALRKEQDDLAKEKASIEALLGERPEAVADDRGRNPRRQKEVRPRDETRPQAHRLRGGARRRRRSRRGDDRARAADRRRLAEGLDPRAERPGRRPVDRDLQGRRRPRRRRSSPRRPRRSWCSRATARFSPSTRRSCRAGAGRASRSGSWPTSTRAPPSSPSGPMRPAPGG